MADAAAWLPAIWAAIICLSLVVYAALDGFDLGAAVIFARARSGAQRDAVMDAIAPFWDGNETWLIVLVTTIFGAFPAAYAILMPALYMPVFGMILGLVFRGVAFEFRHRTLRAQGFWDAAFITGSLAAAFFQGAAFGAVAQGFSVDVIAHPTPGNMVRPFDWLRPVPLLGGVFVTALYALIGCAWVEGRLAATERHRGLALLARRTARMALAALGLVVAVFFAMIPAHMMDGEPVFLSRLRDLLFSMPPAGTGAGTAASGFWVAAAAAGAAAAAYAGAWWALQRRGGYGAFLWAVALMACLLLLFCTALWPYIVPPLLTIQTAAAPPSSQAFLLAGTAVVLPIILGYTAFTYAAFLRQR